MSDHRDGDAFELQPSTWSLVLEHCPSSELDEVKRLLGVALVEQNIEFYEEVSKL